MKALEKKIQKDELKPDEHQVKITEELQRIYDQIQTYQPPDTTGASATPGFFSKLFRTKPKLDPSLRLKGMYIYGSVGGGKTMLMDMFYDCCTQVSDLDKSSVKKAFWMSYIFYHELESHFLFLLTYNHFHLPRLFLDPKKEASTF